MPELPTGPSKETQYHAIRAKEDADRARRALIAQEQREAMEPLAHGEWLISQAISLKRIADCLERKELRHVGVSPPGPRWPSLPVPEDVRSRHYRGGTKG